jgi:putative membrane protein
MSYDLLRGLHILSVIAWMAGLLYLPRLYVYHCQTVVGTDEYQRFCVMEAKLMRLIMNPAMGVAWVLGVWLLSLRGWSTALEPWLFAKLVLVVLQTGVHHMFSRIRKRFAAGQNMKSERYYRMINEIPFVIAIAIVLLATIEPR